MQHRRSLCNEAFWLDSLRVHRPNTHDLGFSPRTCRGLTSPAKKKKKRSDYVIASTATHVDANPRQVRANNERIMEADPKVTTRRARGRTSVPVGTHREPRRRQDSHRNGAAAHLPPALPRCQVDADAETERERTPDNDIVQRPQPQLARTSDQRVRMPEDRVEVQVLKYALLGTPLQKNGCCLTLHEQ